MTLAPVVDAPPAELLPARADTDSWVTVVREVTILAQQIADTEFVPRGLRGSVPATAAAMLYGREVGLPPMTALSQIHVVDGRPALAAEAMRALVLAAGHEIAFDETTSAVCRIRGRRLRSQTWTPVEWTIDQARRAGLLRRGSGWENYPRAMLVARATTELCRQIFPDVIHGFRSVEELDDLDGVASPDPSSRRDRTTVSRRRTKSPTEQSEKSADPAPGGPGSAAPPSPPGHRTPSLPGESEAEDGGDASLAPPSSPPVPPQIPPIPPPRHAGRAVEDVPLPDPETGEGDPDAPAPVNRVTLKLVFGQLRRLGLGDDDQGRPERLALLGRLTNRPDLASANDLTQDEGTQIATILSTFRDADALDLFLAEQAAAQIAQPTDEEES